MKNFIESILIVKASDENLERVVAHEIQTSDITSEQAKKIVEAAFKDEKKSGRS